MNGLLQPGAQTVSVSATNCAGTTVSGFKPTVTYSPLPATAGFQQLAGHAETCRSLPPDITLAYDGLTLGIAS